MIKQILIEGDILLPENYNKYKHFISLGANCFVSEDIIKLGLRNCSYPFDWLFSADFSGVISAIESDFSEFLSYDVLMQHNDSKSRYYNSAYKFSFYHDFNKFQSLKSQLPHVQEKYNRRIVRFKKDITEPTVFFRYIISKNDIAFVVSNHERINTLIKSFCPENSIVYLTHYEELLSLPYEVYLIEKDKDDWITRTPLLKNTVLHEKLQNTYFENKDFNKKFIQKTHKKFSLERALRRFFKKEYTHINVYRV